MKLLTQSSKGSVRLVLIDDLNDKDYSLMRLQMEETSGSKTKKRERERERENSAHLLSGN